MARRIVLIKTAIQNPCAFLLLLTSWEKRATGLFQLKYTYISVYLDYESNQKSNCVL